MNHLSFANRSNSDIIDERFQQWRESPDSLDPEWRAFFEGFELALQYSKGDTSPTKEVGGDEKSAGVQSRVIGAIYAYRSMGHTEGAFNPLVKEIIPNPRLSLERLGLADADLDVVMDTGNFQCPAGISVKDLLDRLRKTYCGKIGIEYLHVQETPKRRWIQSRIEPNCFEPEFSTEEKERIYRKIASAEDFERMLHSRFVGQKRFSLEGGESLITALDQILQRMPALGMKEIVMGMAHRGRLNVLGNIVGKEHSFIFREFAPDFQPDKEGSPSGDVKYHLGYDNSVKTESGETIDIRLAANPSHLEAVNSVVEGKARARQRIIGDLERKQVVPILIHGDAAIAGQGVVAEVCNFSKLKGYRTGGTIHIVVNNQIGFTTDPSDARSSRYCTDVAKMIEAPILHVNGNDPLAVAHAAELAIEYREAFQEDIFLDINCYRKHGHNESDEPAFTQPLLYKAISEMQSPREELRARLIESGDISEERIQEIEKEIHEGFETAFEQAKSGKRPESHKEVFAESNAVFQPGYNFDTIETKVSEKELESVAHVLTHIPDDFDMNRKIERQLKTKRKAFDEDKGVDWAFGEGLAFGTLLREGTPVRLSGQDSERGTFSQRHAAFYDMETRERYVPFSHISEDQAQFCVHNSLLSEAAVLGFDYGYSLEYPEMLSLWEAQFGDFVNGAQVVIDQFIFASESKWQRISGIVLLLPHGYEGQGPEHSSARPERFLQNCAENNIQVCNLTTPAQYFHVLRRQMKRKFSKPLIILTPKSLLRHKRAVSYREDFTDTCFNSILDDKNAPKKAKTLVLCSGKVYYDILEAKEEQGIDNVAIIRVEQYFPFNTKLMKEIVSNYPNFKRVVWCQEEPQNMGAWTFLTTRLEEVFGFVPEYAGRPASASPATGFLARHKEEQAALVNKALTGK
ncbi:2-oxoglutarate dehydrogenase E1 component [Puniceicoccus vermicola]|uniref:oxoglutarate dehydrogenase (succinyl-transferring) n=1 Tax=Puniceicoccus vermicola TaxID=388746 RepID=A0A7X1E5Y2_9BACT|nr:2-oxoglutarate dehydrogenase E1 component [Puniceicoccus vermicola]MBC2603619.1 2-oxoglutarate dehydrogenase E1 component [Puniceicoccus vermicola]